jgi:hypothetical protein
MESGTWTSLEVAKLAVAVLTPILLVLIGLLVARRTKNLDLAHWLNQQLIERKLRVHDEMAPKLNDLYCFFRFRGHFRDISPPAAIDRKRALDKAFHVNRALFTREFQAAYHSFMDACFLTDVAAGADAKLKLDPEELATERGEDRRWDDTWDGRFAAAEALKPTEFDRRYDGLVAAFAKELGVIDGSARS